MTKKTISNLCAYDSKETALCTDERCELWMRPNGVTDKRKGANREWGQTHETWSTQGCLSWNIIILTSPNRQPIYKGAREEEGQEHRHLLRLALNVVWLSRLNEKLPSVQYKGLRSGQSCHLMHQGYAYTLATKLSSPGSTADCSNQARSALMNKHGQVHDVRATPSTFFALSLEWRELLVVRFVSSAQVLLSSRSALLLFPISIVPMHLFQSSIGCLTGKSWGLFGHERVKLSTMDELNREWMNLKEVQKPKRLSQMPSIRLILVS